MARPLDHEAQRRALLQRAFPVFIDHGVADLSMRRLSRELGVTTGTLYHYFDSKQELLEALAALIALANVAALRASLESVGTLTERLDQLTSFFEEHNELLSNGIVLLLEFQRGFHAPGRAAARRVLGSYREAVEELFPELSPEQRLLLYSSLVASVVQAALAPDDLPFSTQIQALAAIRGQA